MAQDAEPRIPVLAMVDEKLFEKKADGYRYADMPPDPDVWREIARMLDAAAAEQGAESFGAAERETQLRIVQRFSEGRAALGGMRRRQGLGNRDARHPQRLLLPPLGLERDRVRRPRLSRAATPGSGAGQREHWESPPEFDLDPVRDVPERGLE